MRYVVYRGLWARHCGSGGREEENCLVLLCRPYIWIVLGMNYGYVVQSRDPGRSRDL